MKKFRKLGAILLTGLLIMSGVSSDCLATAPASSTTMDSNPVPILLTAEAAVLDVVVPTALPVMVDSKGDVTVADNLTIVNKSAAPIDIVDISMSVAPDWTLKPYVGWSPTSEAINSKMISFALNGIETKKLSDGTTNFDYMSATKLSLDAKGAASGEDVLQLVYNAGVTASTRALNNESVATITITCDWTPVS